MADAAERLGSIEAGEWKGPAGDAFRTLIGSQPTRYREAASSFSQAATALSRYAAALRDAQAQARRAIALHEQAHAQTQDWTRQWDRYHADARAAAARGTAPATPRPPDADPGAGDRSRAQRLLDDATSLVRAQANRSSVDLTAAEEAAPRKPRLLDSIMSGVGAVVGAGAGAVTEAWGVATAGLDDVGQWVSDTWDDAAGWIEALGPSLLEVAAGTGLVVVGGMMMVTAAGMEVVGVAADGTVVLAPAGVALNVGGAALAAGGFVVAVGGAALLGQGIRDLIVHMGKGERGRHRHSDFQDESDEEVSKKARDKRTPWPERKRYIEEDKARKQRNARKRKDN